MTRAQKVTFVISVILILVLVTVLGIFLLLENSRTGETENEQAFAQLEEIPEDGQEMVKDEPGLLGGEEPERPEETTGVEPQQPEETTGEGAEFTEQPEILENQDVTMVFTGDILLGDSAGGKYSSGGIGSILSEELQQEMVQADITMINQEFPFSTRGTPMPDKQYTFRVNPSYVSAFLEMGVDVVSLANNHALDYGTEALLDTFAALEEAGIPYVGAGETKERAAQPVFIECKERRIGFLAASRVIPVVSWNIENNQPGMLCTYDSTALVAAIEEAEQQCDYLVVYVHWGVERQSYPEEYQRSLAQAYIDAGADLVVGSHPHVPQGIEYYRGKPIVYSLGNFIFNPDMRGTYMLKVIWKGSGESQLCVIPIDTVSSFTSQTEGQKAEEMLHYIEEISYDITIEESGMIMGAE